MPTNVEEVEDLQSKGNSKDIFKTTSTNANTYMDLVSRKLFGFHRYSIDAENYKCVLFEWHKEQNKFLTLFIMA